MYRGQRIAVVIPARDEAAQIDEVLCTLPDLVDGVFVVDDGSTDETALRVRERAAEDPRIRLLAIPPGPRRGVGAAIALGYRESMETGHDIIAVMAGDGQMDPEDLEGLLDPLATGQADYVKGNRFTYPGGLRRIPRLRKMGNFVLSALTKIVTGYWHISDSQCGYTAIHRDALRRIDLETLYPGYGYPNDLLSRLNAAELRVAEVPVSPRYGVGERSKMRIPRVVLPIYAMLCRAFVRRLTVRYVLTDGHPLVFVYGTALLALLGAAGLGTYIAIRYVTTGWIMKAALILGSALLILGIQLTVSAFSMDQEANRHLCIRLPLGKRRAVLLPREGDEDQPGRG